MWEPGRRRLIPSTKTVAWKSHTFQSSCFSPPWSRMIWKKSIWYYVHTAKWWMPSYIARFLATVAIQMLSSWNLDTICKYFWLKWRELHGSWVPSTWLDHRRWSPLAVSRLDLLICNSFNKEFGKFRSGRKRGGRGGCRARKWYWYYVSSDWKNRIDCILFI